MNLGELPAVCGKTYLYFQLERHVYLITEGSIVTSSIILQKYTRYVIITRRKPLCFLFCEAQCCASAPIFWTIWSIKLCHTDMNYGKFVFRDFSAKQNIKKHRLFCNLINFLAMKNRTRQTGEWSVICTRPTLLTLAWASGRALMSNPEFQFTLLRFYSERQLKDRIVKCGVYRILGTFNTLKI